MTADQLIIEDFDFSRYPITRIYPLGGKTVIQIGESLSEKPKKLLLDKIDELEHDLEVAEEEKESAESELEKAEKELTDTEEKHEEYLHKIDCALESAEFNLKIDTSSRHSYDRISEIAAILSEKIEELELNRALADTIFRQEQTIAKLEEQLLAAQEN